MHEFALDAEFMTSSVGTDLRHARERARLSLPDLSARTKIRVALLERIEREQFERLPTGLLTRGYLRAYAREVGLDPETVVRQYVEAFESERLSPPATRQQPPDTEWDPEPAGRTRWAILAPAIPLTLAALFFMLISRPAEVRAPVPVPPMAPVTPIGTTGQQQVGAKAMDAAAPTGTATNERLRIEIYPTAVTWIEASVDDGRVLYELVDAGQRRTLEANRAIALRIGDAAAFAYSINGMPGRSLGGPGEVRDIEITRDNVDSFVIRD
jgi:transcriptional regulator with XRE-family HTH domain